MRKLSILLLLLYTKVYANLDSCLTSSDFIQPEFKDDYAELTGDQSSISKNRLNLSGNALLKTNNFSLSADNIVYSKNESKIFATGKVRYLDLFSRLLSKNISLNSFKNNNLKNFKSDSANFLFFGSGLRGYADEIIGNNESKTLIGAKISTCPTSSTDWVLKANSITLRDNIAIAKDVIVDFFGKPIFYFPYIEWSTKGRKSGFLAPDFKQYNDSSGDTSYSVNIPYYFNLASDKDLLLNTKYLSNRGTSIGSKYRQLINLEDINLSGNFDINLDYLNKDSLLKYDRWIIDSNLSLSSGDSNILARLNRVSDKNYLRDIYLENIAKERLISSISLNNKTNGIDYELYSEDEQLINNGASSYTKNLELSFGKSFFDDNDLSLKLSGGFVDFRHKNVSLNESKRSHLQLDLKKIYKNNIFQINPNLNLSSTKYDEDSNSINRNIIQFNIDATSYLERDLFINNKKYTQDLIPRFKYFFSQKKDQSMINNYDTELIPETYHTLFSNKKFTGIDKISNQNSIALGIETNLFKSVSGENLISLRTGQKFRFSDTEVNLSGAQEAVSSHSDIFNNISFYKDNLSLVHDFNYDTKLNKISKSLTSFTFQPSPNKSFNLFYIDDNDEENIDLSLALPYLYNTKLSFEMNRSITDSRLNRLFADINHETCCWTSRISYSKNHTGSNNYDDQIAFNIIFKGLTSEGL